MPGEAPRIWMDGFGLSLVSGTGIATYSRGLAATLGETGLGLGLLYGRPMPRGTDAMAREVAFFDSQTRLSHPLMRRMVSMLGPQRATPVTRSGTVDRTLTSAGLHKTFSTVNVPPCDELWNANDIFGRGVVNMRVRGRLLRLSTSGGPPPALMHWTHLHGLRLEGARNLYTIHDAIPLRLPWATLDHKGAWITAARAVAASAEHIITVSEHARRDLMTLLNIPAERITNTYQPVHPPSHGLDPRMSRERLSAVFGLEDRGFHMCLAAVDPRKNLARMLDAYVASGITRPLVIVGGKSGNAEPELRLLTEANGTRSRDGRIRHLGYLPRTDVDVLLRHARSLCFPTLYEGFGLPAIEAMQAGTAVLTSDTSCMPEVVGDAALKVPPTDLRALTEAVTALDSDDALRERLQAAGPARAALFTPARHAARLGEVYARLGVPFERQPA